MTSEYDARLMCRVYKLEYDYGNHVGEIWFPRGHCCDMSACVVLFKSIDPKVTRIQTYSGWAQGVCYDLAGTEWIAE